MSAVSASILSSQLGPFEEALRSFSAKLPHSQRTQFTSTTTTQQDVEILAAKLQHGEEGRKGYRAMGLLQPFIDGLAEYSKVIEVFAQTSEILAFVWGPIKFLIQIISKWHRTMDKLMEALAAVGVKLLIYEKCSPIVREDLRFKKILVRVYTDILDLLWTALRIFGKNTVKQFLEIQSPVFDKKLTGVLSNLSNDEDLIRDAVSVTTLNQTIKFHQSAEEEFRAAAKQRLYTTLQLFRQELQPALISSSRLEGAKKISSKYPGAGSWLANHPKFLSWRNFQSNERVLILYGIPGAGKTTLSSIMANLLQNDTSTGASNVAHLALDFQTGQNNDCSTALRSLLYDQLARFPDHAEAILEDLGGEYVQRLCATEKIQDLLEGIFQCYSPIFLFIDGLDELASDGEIRKFMVIIEDFILKCPELRIFLSCRPEALIKSRAKGWNTAELVLSVRDSHRDIESYVLHAENKNFLINEYGLDDTNATAYLKAIVDKSDGMFLYAKLIIGILPDLLFGVIEIEDLINQLPNGLEQAYERSLQRISNLPKNIRKQAKRIFKFVLGGKRSFRTIELVQAIEIHSNMKNHGKQRQASLELICGSLIETASDGIISLVHSSLKSYLLECDDILGLRKFSVQLTLSRVCLEYLSIKSLQEQDTILYQNVMLSGEFVFLSYACKNLSLHFKQATHESGLNSISRKKLTKFLVALEKFSVPLIIASQPEEKTLSTIISELRSCLETYEEQQNRLQLQYAITQFLVELQGTNFKSIIAKQLAALMEHFNRNLTQVSGSCDPKSIQALIRLYGPPFRCFDSACHHFYSGFMEQAEQERHAASHSKSFKCPQMSCPYHQIGFLSINELDKHDKAAHSKFLVASRTLERPKSDRSQQGSRDILRLNGFELAKTASLMLKSGDLAGAKEILVLMSRIPNLKLRQKGEFTPRFMAEDICLEGVFQRQPEDLEECLACYANGDILADLGNNIFRTEGVLNLVRAILSKNLSVIKYLLPTVGRIRPWNFELLSREEIGQYLKTLLSEIARSNISRGGYERLCLTFPFEFYVHWVGDEKISEALKGFATIYSDSSEAELASRNALFLASIAGNLSAVSSLLDTGATLSKACLESLLAKMISSENGKLALMGVCSHLKSRGAAFWSVTADEVFVRGLKLRLLQTKHWSAFEFFDGMERCLELGVSPTDINEIWSFFPLVGCDGKEGPEHEIILDAELYESHLSEVAKVIRPLLKLGISATYVSRQDKGTTYKTVSLSKSIHYNSPSLFDGATAKDIASTIYYSLTERELAWELHRKILYDWMETFSTKYETLELVNFNRDFREFFAISERSVSWLNDFRDVYFEYYNTVLGLEDLI